MAGEASGKAGGPSGKGQQGRRGTIHKARLQSKAEADEEPNREAYGSLRGTYTWGGGKKQQEGTRHQQRHRCLCRPFRAVRTSVSDIERRWVLKAVAWIQGHVPVLALPDSGHPHSPTRPCFLICQMRGLTQMILTVPLVVKFCLDLSVVLSTPLSWYIGNARAWIIRPLASFRENLKL